MNSLSFIDRWLPPPRILRPSYLGVDISESSIKYIGFDRARSGLSPLRLEHWGEIEIGPDVVERGEVKDVKTLARSLAEVKKRTGVGHVRLSLPEERVYLFETEIERETESSDIRELLEFRLEENVPLSPRDAYFDYRLRPAEEGGSLTAAVAVCPKSVADAYYETCRPAGVTPLSFEVESQAIARAVLPAGDSGTKLLVDFGKTRTGIGIVHREITSYTSTIDIGGNELSASMKRQLGEREESELTKIKNDQGLVRATGSNSPSEALLPVVSVIKDEILTHMQYWNNKHTASRPIAEVVLCGGTANLRGLPEYFRETLGIATSVADVWQNAFDAKISTPPIDRHHSFGYATAIGLALASFAKTP